MSRVLVTGGAGFIGRHVVDALRADGDDVAVLDSLRPDVHVSAPAELPEHLADVRDLAAVAAAIHCADVVVHLAAKVGLGVRLDDIDDYVSSNDLGTAVLLRAAAVAGVPHVVMASSMVVYGDGAYRCPEHGPVPVPPRRAEDLERGRFEPRCVRCGSQLLAEPVDEAAPFDPRNAYAASKVQTELLSRVWARETGGSVTALRFHNVYGPGMPRHTPYAGVASLFHAAAERGEAPRVFEDGGQRRDFVHARDVAGAVAAAVRRPGPAGEVTAYNVGSGRVTTVGQLAAAIADRLGAPAPVTTGEYRLGDVRHITASSERIAAGLGWRAVVPLETGLAELGEPAGVAQV
ncbi:MAG TPA: NAD-dependent epimerase/dehydratase family protein [Kribbellaceae bacterium]